MIRRLLEWLRDWRKTPEQRIEEVAEEYAALLLAGSGKQSDEDVNATLEMAERNLDKVETLKRNVDKLLKRGEQQ